MANWLRTRPVNDPSERQRIVIGTSCIFLIGTLPLFLLGFMALWIIDNPNKENASEIALGFVFWLFGLVFMVPALLIAAPFASVALRRGFAGWSVSIFACSLVMTSAFLLMALPQPDITVLYVGIAAGAVFGSLYWVSAFCAAPSAFRNTLPESD
jgi:hypothetical protein